MPFRQFARTAWFKYALCGAGAGAINGFFGAGGGVLLVPLLVSYAGLPEKNAFATSLFVMLPACAVSSVAYFSSGAIEPGTALPYLLGGLAGGLLCGRVYAGLSVLWLRRLFAVILLIGGIRALFL